MAVVVAHIDQLQVVDEQDAAFSLPVQPHGPVFDFPHGEYGGVDDRYGQGGNEVACLLEPYGFFGIEDSSFETVGIDVGAADKEAFGQ